MVYFLYPPSDQMSSVFIRRKYKSHHTDSNLKRIKIAEDNLQLVYRDNKPKLTFEVHTFA